MGHEATAPGRQPPGRRCGRAARAIDRLADGRLGAVGMLSLRRHTANCPECGNSFRRMSAVIEALENTVPVRAPEGFTGGVLERLAGEAAAPAAGHAGDSARRGFLWVAGAALLGVGVAVGVAAASRLRVHHPVTGEVEENLAAGRAAV